MKQKQKRKIGWINRIAYGSGNLIGSGALAISGAWLLYFYTSFCGLSVVQASLIFSVATYLDVIINPIMGFITDSFYKTRLGRKFGRRRFFILIAIPLVLVYPMLWVKNMNFFYYLTTYVMFEIIYTSIMIPYETIAVEMTDDFEQRSYLAGLKAMFGNIANFLGAAIPGIFIAIFGKDTPKPFFYTGVVYCVIMMVSLTLLYFNTWERSYEEVADESVGSLFEAIKKLFTDILSTLRVKTFRHHLGMYLFGFGAEWLFTAVFTYFVVFVLNQPSAFVSEMNSLNSVLQLIATTAMIGIVAKKGFSKPYIWALTVVIATVLGYVVIALTGLTSLTALIIGVTVVFGLGTGAVYYVPWTTYTFLADVDEIVTDRRREGTYAGAMTMAGKLTRASIVFILGAVLSAFGFESGATVQPQSAVNAITGVMIFGVCGMALLAIFFSCRLKLNHDTHKILIDEIDRVHGGGKMADVDPKTKEVIESLTGIPYENCFGNNNIGYKHKEKKTTNEQLAHE